MRNALVLAWAYLCYHRGRSVLLLASLTLLIALPWGLHLLIEAAQTGLLARAESTPLLIGARASAFDLTLSSLYFTAGKVATVPARIVDDVAASGLARPVPLYVHYRARGATIVGTTLDYFEFRALTLARGRPFALIGEAVLGEAIATRLGLAPGATLTTDPDTSFNLAAGYPLRLRIVGVLGATGGPDDEAVFVDVKTAWILGGALHGHADLARAVNPGEILARDGATVTASAQVTGHTEIDAANLGDFHLHGDPAALPLTAVIAATADERATALLRGRFIDSNGAQAIVPRAEIEVLLGHLFRVRALLDAVFGWVGLAALLLLGLVYAFTARLRAAETLILAQLGAARGFIARLFVVEIALLGAAAIGVSALLMAMTQRYIGGILDYVLHSLAR